ncbi:hypothetical protein BDV95DRAFT_610109 [Massariosphaeria phaeospora]|uniref:F-box domain-containing protein n=1 Tax=Massariosphaeria phaeospora TaxID=100035 RepID=A0A7C8M4D1_9PLEO|nr:hypothetical protein BDV95DRAFT_610109 [Massariosphaeria phaeospora]
MDSVDNNSGQFSELNTALSTLEINNQPTIHKSTIFDLPDEILLNIASYLEAPVRQPTLCNLALTNHRLHRIAQDELWRTPSFALEDTPHMALRLIRQPEYRAHVQELHIQERGFGFETPIPFLAELQTASAECCRVMNVPDAAKEAWNCQLQSVDIGYILASFAILLAITPALKTLKLPKLLALALNSFWDGANNPESSHYQRHRYLATVLEPVVQRLVSLKIDPSPPLVTILTVDQLVFTQFPALTELEWYSMISKRAPERFLPSQPFRMMLLKWATSSSLN